MTINLLVFRQFLFLFVTCTFTVFYSKYSTTFLLHSLYKQGATQIFLILHMYDVIYFQKQIKILKCDMTSLRMELFSYIRSAQ